MRRVPLHGGRSEVQRLHFGGALWILSAGKGGFGIGCGTRTGKEKLETVRVGSNDEKYTLGDLPKCIFHRLSPPLLFPISLFQCASHSLYQIPPSQPTKSRGLLRNVVAGLPTGRRAAALSSSVAAGFGLLRVPISPVQLGCFRRHQCAVNSIREYPRHHRQHFAFPFAVGPAAKVSHPAGLRIRRASL